MHSSKILRVKERSSYGSTARFINVADTSLGKSSVIPFPSPPYSRTSMHCSAGSYMQIHNCFESSPVRQITSAVTVARADSMAHHRLYPRICPRSRVDRICNVPNSTPYGRRSSGGSRSFVSITNRGLDSHFLLYNSLMLIDNPFVNATTTVDQSYRPSNQMVQTWKQDQTV